MITERIIMVPIQDLVESCTNPRKLFNEESLYDLSLSIKQKGILQPLLVRPLDRGYEVIVGSRRLRAAKLAHLTSIPCLVKNLDSLSIIEIQLIENVQREDLHPLDEAECYQTLMKKYGYKAESLALRIGKSAQHVWKVLKLLELSPSLKESYRKGEINGSKADILARLDEGNQKELGKKCNDMGTSSFRQLARNIRLEQGAPRAGDRGVGTIPEIVKGLRDILLNPIVYNSREAVEIVSNCFKELTVVLAREV